MRALDTPAILALLEDRPEAASLLEGLGTEEVGTTEVNLFELETAARASPRRLRSRRLAALERLRRKLTVLPVDGSAARRAAQLAAAQPRRLPGAAWLMLGALEASGVPTLVTVAGTGLEEVRSSVRIELLRRSRSKNRKERDAPS